VSVEAGWLLTLNAASDNNDDDDDDDYV